MARFRYIAKRGPKETVTGFMDGESERTILAHLREMGYIPVSVEPCHESSDHLQLKRLFSRIRLKDKNIFFRQLANLYESGMPLLRALTTLEAQTTNPKMRQVLTSLRTHIQEGASLAESMEQHPRVFSPVQCSLVHAGETGGMLEEALWRIVDFGEHEEEVRGKAFTAMAYPAFLLFAASIALFILITFVFPRFTKVFEDFELSLPLITIIVMNICDFMARFWWGILLGLAVLATLFFRFLRTPAGRETWDKFILKIPVVGTVVHRYQMAQFARVFGTLIDNGVPVLTALGITASTLSNQAIAKEIERIKGFVEQGESIHTALQQSPYFPPMVISMFATGEESGRLGAVTKRMADAYDKEVERAVKTLTALLEPAMILIIGSVVGVLVIAMLLPMLTLSVHVS